MDAVWKVGGLSSEGAVICETSEGSWHRRVLCFDYRNEVGNVCIVGSSLSGLKKGRKDIDRARCLLGSATWPRRTPYSGDG